MPTVLAPYKIERTIGQLTFYMWEGVNFVRRKSSLTRKRVLHSPKFARTRHYAGLMGSASKIGSAVYKQLPVAWRQGWMYRAFTGEAYTLLKEGVTETAIKQQLWERYVREVAEKCALIVAEPGGTTSAAVKQSLTHDEGAQVLLRAPVKRMYHKRDSGYWNNKISKGVKRRAFRARTQRYAGLLAQAAVIASEVYRQLPVEQQGRDVYQQLTGMVMRYLKVQHTAGNACTDPGPEQVVTAAGGNGVSVKHKPAIYITDHKNNRYVMTPGYKGVGRREQLSVEWKSLRNGHFIQRVQGYIKLRAKKQAWAAIGAGLSLQHNKTPT
jgi:hypothetical protein